ncbi:MAG: CidA/LrgA family protein [Clostridiales bacterium]|nr:CidA/LrgA family protein [Clostridiales bacterium]
MKYIKQFSIILAVSFMGEILYALLPLPIPASVYGLALLLLGLMTGICKVDQIKETADFLIEIMPVMFIPAGVGLLTSWGILRPVWIPIAVITVITTVLVMAVTGRTTQSIIRREKKRKAEKR